MAQILVVPEKDWEILAQYIDNKSALILIPEHVLTKLPEVDRVKLTSFDGDHVNYDFGGEPDIMVDIIYGPESFACRSILGDIEAEDQ